jgi:hypothetical protein
MKKTKDNVTTLSFVGGPPKVEPMNDFLKEIMNFKEELRLWELRQTSIEARVAKLEQDNKNSYCEEFKRLMQ